MKHTIVIGLMIALTLLFLCGPAVAQEQETKEVTLIRGLDGGDYEPYLPSVIERVQEALRGEGLYDGEANGILDEATMTAIGEFQEQNGLQVSGVPSPRTRQLLLQPAAGEEETEEEITEETAEESTP